MVSPRPIGPNAPRGPRITVEFEPNTPVELALKFAKGKVLDTRSGQRVMFSLADGRVMFLDPDPARTVDALGARAGEKICICMQWTGKRGDPKEWTAWLSTDTELRRAQAAARENGGRWNTQQLEKKMIQRETAAAIAPAVKTAPPAPAQMLEPESLALLSQSRQLIDVFWLALSYARKEYGDQVGAAEVAALVQAAFAKSRQGR